MAITKKKKKCSLKYYLLLRAAKNSHAGSKQFGSKNVYSLHSNALPKAHSSTFGSSTSSPRDQNTTTSTHEVVKYRSCALKSLMKMFKKNTAGKPPPLPPTASLLQQRKYPPPPTNPTTRIRKACHLMAITCFLGLEGGTSRTAAAAAAAAAGDKCSRFGLQRKARQPHTIIIKHGRRAHVESGRQAGRRGRSARGRGGQRQRRERDSKLTQNKK